MPFLLAGQRDADVTEAFRRYRQYLEQERLRFPSGAFALATSDWYFDFSDHRCPHDAWLEHLVLHETGQGERRQDRTVALSVELLVAYHDLLLTFEYRGVRSYSMESVALAGGHMDWRYDEFRVAESGGLVHDIEWCGPVETARWLIEADDVAFTSRALARGA